MVNLSVTIATKDEAKNILRCMKSVPFAMEYIVVDDCSSDNCAEIARDFGARVFIRDSKGSFHENKNFAINEAKCEWVLSLDADEIVSGELAESIKKELKNPIHDGYRIDRHNYFFNQWIRGCGWYPDNILRLFRRGYAEWPLNIHETPKLKNGTINMPVLEGELIHYSYTSYEQYFEKFNRYTTRLAVEYFQQNRSMAGLNFIINLFLRPGFWFIKKFIFLKGYQDGLQGFFISFSSALAIFVSYLKFLQNRGSIEKY